MRKKRDILEDFGFNTNNRIKEESKVEVALDIRDTLVEIRDVLARIANPMYITTSGGDAVPFSPGGGSGTPGTGGGGRGGETKFAGGHGAGDRPLNSERL